MSDEDYLEVDKPIPGQNYTCISFVSPDDCIKQKELFFLWARAIEQNRTEQI